MRNILIIIEYDGTGYHGWQMQKNAGSVQAVLEKALSTILRETVKTMASGRTDTGVHAVNQPVTFKTNSKMETRRIFRALNGILPDDIVIKSVKEVAADFDARRSARSKIYRYVILNSNAPSALYRHRAWHVRENLDTDLMLEGAKMLIGEHDFSSFRGSGCTSRHPLRRMLDVKINVVGENKEYIYFEIEGEAFLKHMVRNIVGTLVALGMGRINLSRLKDILEAKDRREGGVTAPPHGLYLVNVKY